MSTTLRMQTLFALFLCLSLTSKAQIPGQIIKRTSVNTVLDPVTSTGFTSSSTGGFVTNDISESRIPYKIVKLPVTEPVADLATGPNGGFTDIVPISGTDGSGFLAHYDGTNLLFRLRVGGIVSGAKGYSILIDADNKLGNSGVQADPNYIAPTSQGSGNIGFEWEILFTTGNTPTVSLYNIDGVTGQNKVLIPPTYTNNYQISLALSTNSNNPDYFYDFYIPVAAFTGQYALATSTGFRFVATSVTSPTSALQGSRSDIFGFDDAGNPNVSTTQAWQTVGNYTPPVTLTDLGGTGTTIGAGGSCTAPPMITSNSVSITSGAATTSVTGNWSNYAGSAPSASIKLYRYSSNGILLNTYTNGATSVSSGNWTITGVQASAGDYFIAKATGTTLNELECLSSNKVNATCSSPISAPVLTQSSSKGICGTIPTNAKVLIYILNAGTAAPTLLNANDANTTYNYSASPNFTWYSCQSGNNISNGTYMVVTTLNGCISTPVFDCITSGAGTLSGLNTNTVSISGTVYSYQNSITVNVPTSTSTQTLRLFKNGIYEAGATVAANTTTHTFNGLQLSAGDALQLYLQPTSGCVTQSSVIMVQCYIAPPMINTNNTGGLEASANTISGTATANASITVNRTSAPTANWTTSANSNGYWSVSVPSLTASETYTATVTAAGSCSNAATSAQVSVQAAPSVICPAITGTYNPTAGATNISVSITTGSNQAGTLRLYFDYVEVASTAVGSNVSNATFNLNSVNQLYNGAVLQATYQVAGATEYLGCPTNGDSYYTIACASSTAAPTVNNPATSMNAGQTITYTVTSPLASTYYSLRDQTGKTYSSVLTTASPVSFSLSATISVPGTYTMSIFADKYDGCTPGSQSRSLMVNAVLPVHFVSVSARGKGNHTEVKWEVRNEINVSHYIIEKSTDCYQFQPIGKIDWINSNSDSKLYSWIDTKANTGKVCYRIKQVDLDGKIQYSAIVTINVSDLTVTITPNPAQHTATLNILGFKDEVATIEIRNIDGKVVSKRNTQIRMGANSIPLHGLNVWARGTYFIQVISSGGIDYQKLILQ